MSTRKNTLKLLKDNIWKEYINYTIDKKDSYISNAKQGNDDGKKIHSVINYFIKKELIDYDKIIFDNLTKDISAEEISSKTFFSPKTFKDLLEAKATLELQNILGYFIYKEKWEKLDEELYNKLSKKHKGLLKPIVESNKSILSKIIEKIFDYKLYLLLCLLLIFLTLLYFKTITIHASQDMNIQSTVNTFTKPHTILTGTISSNNNKKIPKVQLYFEKYNYKVETDSLGHYQLENPLLLNDISAKLEIDVWISHNKFETTKYTFNKNLFVFNDTLSNITIKKNIKEQPNNGTQINIDVINNEKGSIHIGNSTTVNTK